jgi:hypothetical protein
MITARARRGESAPSHFTNARFQSHAYEPADPRFSASRQILEWYREQRRNQIRNLNRVNSQLSEPMTPGTMGLLAQLPALPDEDLEGL